MQSKKDTDIEGLDISSWQTIVDEYLFFDTTPHYVVFRCHGSDGNLDVDFLDNVALAKKHGVKSGAYYFGQPKHFDLDADAIADAQAQAQEYIDQLYIAYGTGNTGDITPWLDIEEYTDPVTGTTGYPKASGMTGDQLILWIEAFRDHFWNTTKRRLGFYSNRYFLTDSTQMALTKTQLQELADMPLWLAEYDKWYGGETGNVQPEDLGGWTIWSLWQYAVIADADKHGLTHGTNEVDHNRCSDVSWITLPPKIDDFQLIDNHDGTLTVKMDQPKIPDYIGTSVYLDGVWKAWIDKANLSDSATITGLTIGQTYSIHLSTEDTYHDFTQSDAKTITLAEATGGNTMAKATSGLTTESVKRFVIDAGAVYVNIFEADERLLGATRGGSSFAIEQEIKLVEIDSVRGATKGARRVVESNARLTTNLLEMSTDNLLIAIAGATATAYTDTTETPAPTAPTHDEIKRTRNLTDIDYIKNIALVGTIQGTTRNIIIIIYNALADEGLEMSFEDREEAVVEVTFTAHYDPANVNEEPWSILMPLP